MFIFFFRNLRYPFRTSLCGNPYRPIGVFKLAGAGLSRPSLFILVFKVNIIFVWFRGGAISLESMEVPTYKKNYCEEEPYQFRDNCHLWTQTERHRVTFIYRLFC